MSKCNYCDFNSVASPHLFLKTPNSAPLKAFFGKSRTHSEDEYIDALTLELRSLLNNQEELKTREVTSIYFGGGTPSMLLPGSIAKIIYEIEDTFEMKNKEVEVTLEANPETIDTERLSAFKRSGINRLSIGVQSFDDSVLKILGRQHSAKRGADSILQAREVGFTNIGLDLIFAVPEQSLNSWASSIEQAIELNTEHISIYGLTIEEGTPFFSTLSEDSGFKLPSEESEVLMYQTAIKALKKAGFNHDEISNMSKTGFESKHNLRYWRGGDYIGLGSGAHSYLSSNPDGEKSKVWGRRWQNEADIKKYIELAKASNPLRQKVEDLNYDDALAEALMLGLRLPDGIDVRAFSKRFGITPELALTSKAHAKHGLTHTKDGFFSLTDKGILFSNEVF
ncbi:MAG: radical SAM family heme chaperone HemW [Deltaproteobacteria bacterium]|nr:radical SAM family heme chaperone HemW [Deltaproteobacteria bacterium]